MSPRVWVAGVPAAQGSKRHVGGGRMVESSKAVGPWRLLVQRTIAETMPELEPTRAGVVVFCRFVFLRPGGHFGTRECLTCKPPSRAELLERAGAAAIAGRSKMSADELADALGVELPDRASCAACNGSGRERFVRPTAPRVPAARPDLDKLTRAVLDALTGTAIADDGQVVALNVCKEYGNAGGAEIRWDTIA